MRAIDGDIIKWATERLLGEAVGDTLEESMTRCAYKGILAAINAAPTLGPVIVWTPVEKGLPEHNGWYLASVSDGDAALEAYYFNPGEWDNGDHTITSAVTAWAEKPAPYKAVTP